MIDWGRVAYRSAAITILILVLVGTFRGVRSYLDDTGGSDFFAIYSAGATLSYDYDTLIAHEAGVQRALGKGPFEIRFPYPPHLLFVAAPFSRLPVMPAHALFSALQFALMALGFYLLNGKRPATWLTFLAFQPLYEGLRLGQYTGLVFLGYALLMWSERRERPAWMVAGLALLSLKPQFALFPLVFVLARPGWRRRAGLYAVLLVAALVALAFAVIGFHQIPDAFDQVFDVMDISFPRDFDLRSGLPSPILFAFVWAGGLAYSWVASDIRWAIFLGVLLSPTLAAHDLVYFLALIPAIESRVALLAIAWSPLIALVIRETVPPIVPLYVTLVIVYLTTRTGGRAIQTFPEARSTREDDDSRQDEPSPQRFPVGR